MLQIGYNIEQMRLLKGMSREDFSEIFEKYKLNPDKLYSYEKGKAKPNPILIEKFAEYAGVTVEELLNKRLSERDMFHQATYTTKTVRRINEDTKKPDEGELIRRYEKLIERQESQINQLLETVKHLNEVINSRNHKK